MLESGQILAARYGLLRKLGEGHAAQVWQARDRTMGADCVLKVLTDSSPAEREQFLRAARLQLELRHPRLQACVSVHDGEPPFAVFAELARGDLTELRGRPWRTLLPVLAGVAEGLAALHARGLVHRDLKPANVLIGTDGAPLIADFGLAAAAGDPGVPRGGSPFSMSPQQLDGAPPAPADDVYAFGVLAHELLTGYPPFYPDPQPGRVRDEPPAPLAVRFGVPTVLEELVRRCLAKVPADRRAGGVRAPPGARPDHIASSHRRGARDRAAVVPADVGGPDAPATALGGVPPRAGRRDLRDPAARRRVRVLPVATLGGARGRDVRACGPAGPAG